MRIRTPEQRKLEAEYARSRYHNNPEYRAKKKAKMKLWATENKQSITPEQKERYREYERNRAKTPKRMQQRREAQKRYREKMQFLGLYKKHRGNRTIQSRRWKERAGNKTKSSAHNQVYAAIKKGLMRKQPCEVCGEQGVAHHDDYAKPLDVRWLCNLHHYQHHKSLVS